MASRSLAAVDEGVPLEQADLLERCLRGERGAQRAFYDRHVRFVLRTARRLGTPPEEIEDVAQEVFSVAFRKLGQFQSGKVSTWLYQICSHRVQHHHSARRLRQTIARVFGASPIRGALGGQERATEQLDAERRVSEILARMSPKKREVLVLFEFEGLPGEAIAERVGCPLDTVWTRLYHARREFARIGRAYALAEKARSGG
jgi:RNA polymerase sigma-70 factor (ECF subfamily)